MKILVCVKQVPDTNEVKIDPKTGTLIRDGVPSIINHDDKNALEEVLKIKDTMKDCHVTVVCMGPPQADVALREALAMGADDAVLLSDRAFGGSDTWATSYIIAEAIRQLGNDFDIIFCGRQAIDGDTAQVGPQIAEKLGLPQVTYVQKMEINGDTIRCQRALEDGYQVIDVKMPCVLTAIKELNEPRYSSIGGIFDAYEKEIKIMTLKEVPIDTAKAGVKGSPTNVYKTFTPSPKGAGTMLEGAGKEAVGELFTKLKEKHIV